MSSSSIDKQFLAIWRRALNQPSLSQLTPDLIADWANARGLKVVDAVERQAGIFQPTPAVELTIEGGKAIFPKIAAVGDPAWENRRRFAENNAALWEKVEWFSPLWVPMGRVTKILEDVKYRSKEQAISLFNYHTSTLYTLSFQAVCIAQIMPQSRGLKELGFIPLTQVRC